MQDTRDGIIRGQRSIWCMTGSKLARVGANLREFVNNLLGEPSFEKNLRRELRGVLRTVSRFWGKLIAARIFLHLFWKSDSSVPFAGAGD